MLWNMGDMQASCMSSHRCHAQPQLRLDNRKQSRQPCSRTAVISSPLLSFGASSFSSISPNLPAAFPRANPLNAQGFGFFSHLGSSTNPGIPSSLLSSSISTSSSSFSPFGSIISAPTSASNTTSSALHSHSAHASSNATIPDQPSADSTIPTANIATATT